MTVMGAALGLGEASLFGHVSEPSPNAMPRKKHLKLFLQAPSPRFSHMYAHYGHHTLLCDGIYVVYRRKKPSSLTLSASLTAVPTSSEEPTLKLAAEKAYELPSIEPSRVCLLDSTPCKSHPKKIRHFPANGTSTLIADGCASFRENPYAALLCGKDAGKDAQEITSNGPSEAVVLCFKCLELSGVSLLKCLKQASSVNEDDVVNLLKSLSSYGFHCNEIKGMLAKYPLLLKLKVPQIEQCLLYYSGLGFSRSIVTSLLYKRPALLACDLDRASKVIDYLLSLGIKKEDLSSIIACRPHILEHDVPVLRGIVSALKKARLDQSEINKLIKRSPSVLTPARGDIDRILSFWSDVGVEGKALYKAILRRPNLLSYNTASMMKTFKYLQGWFDRSNLAKLVFRFAELLSYDPETKLKPLIDYFLELGLSKEEVAKVILRRPQLVTVTLERLKGVANFLTCLGMKDGMAGKVLRTSPQVFTLNTEDKLKRGIEFFRSMGIKNERDLVYVFARSAQLFCCSIEKNLQPTIKFFSDSGLAKEDLAAMVVAFPSMLGQSVDSSLAPKYKYLIEEMKRTNEELVDFPQYFGYSLERRIKPRHKSLLERGLHKSLPSMLACTDSDFQKRHIAPHRSLLPQDLAASEQDSTEPVVVKKQRRRRKNDVHPPEPKKDACPPEPKKDACPHAEFQADLIDQNPVPEDLLRTVSGSEEVPVVENHVNSVNMEWEFLNFIPQLKQTHLYPASFRKHYKTLSPCGIWIHAYKFDT